MSSHHPNTAKEDIMPSITDSTISIPCRKRKLGIKNEDEQNIAKDHVNPCDQECVELHQASDMKMASRVIESSTEEQFSVDKEYNIEDLPAEIVCLVFSFKYHPKLTSTVQSQDTVRTLFQTFGLTSSSFRMICFDYLHKTPLSINAAHVNVQDAIWLASQYAKIGSFRFSSRTHADIGKSLHLLKSCNVSELELLNISGITEPKQSSDEECDQATALGIQLFPAHSLDIQGIHMKTIEALRGRCSPIKSMELACCLVPWYDQLITNYRDSLEQLTLKITKSQDQNIYITSSMAISQMAIVTKLIESMPRLKKLKLQTWFKADINIKSETLEEIDTYFMFDGSFVRKCECPKLKHFKCRNFEQCHQCKNGVLPVLPFEDGELVLLRHGGGIDRWYARPSVDFRVGDRLFRGMKAPNECIVSVKC
eukprot:scaffold10238_cov276-Chaetoceros_neogracile.AAC.7